MLDKNILGMEPIRFSDFYYVGTLGSNWANIDYSLSKLIAQNILYSAYYEARTISEISEFLGVQPSVVEEEIDFLENYGFMDKINNNKYLTKILLHDFSKEISEARHQIFKKYAKIVCEKYVPLLMDNGQWIMENGTPANSKLQSLISSPNYNLQTTISSNIYIPENDINFLLWALVSFACINKFDKSKLKDNPQKYFVKRCDGSESIVYASLEKDADLSYETKKYKSCDSDNIFFLPKASYPCSIWLYNTYYDNRKDDWFRILPQKCCFLYDLMMGRTIGKHNNDLIFEQSLQHGLLRKKETSELRQETATKNTFLSPDILINMLITTKSFEEFIDILPPMPDEFIDINEQLSNQIYEISKHEYPQHIWDTCKAYYLDIITKGDIVTRVLEQCLLNGTLQPLKPHQKQTVNMIMFEGVLP